MKTGIIRSLLAGMALLGAFACVDDFDTDPAFAGEGTGQVRMGVTFKALSNRALGSTRSESGDLIGAIDDLFVVWYDRQGDLSGSAYIPREAMTVTDADRPQSTTEESTQHAEFSCKIPYGTYRIYAAANMGDLSADAALAEQLEKESSFRAIVLEWDDRTGNNAQMSGYFTPDDTGGTRGEAPLLTINAPQQSLHAWIRRAVSKVTVSFDTTNLNENVYIHIRSAHIHNIPRTCTLLDSNDQTRIADPATDVWFASDTIYYGAGEDFNLWPRLTKGGNPLGGTEASKQALHANDAQSLFFFENMQGEGKLKWQDTSGKNESVTFPDGNDPDDEGYRDGKPCGTYIEVEGYYISNTAENPGKGEIRYRFMLGKDTERDYNAERNYHYKLVMRFQGNANDVDWHIDYNEEEGIYAPNPYYISYLYDHEMMLPLKIKGIPTGKLTAEIIENNWGPHDVGAGDNFEYYKGEVYTLSGAPEQTDQKLADLDHPKLKDGPWNGFLSLIETSNYNIGYDQPFWKGYNYFYWKQKDFGTGADGQSLEDYGNNLLLPNEKGLSPRGYREYDVSRSGPVDGNGDGDYIVSVDRAAGKTVVQIPFYTRALLLSDKTGFSGNNPYFSYMRSAKVRFTVQLEGHSELTVDTVTIYQVRRIINPKGIYRSHDNDKKFDVVLTRRMGESASKFSAFPSEGPWDAVVEVGGDWIKLNGVLNNHVKGSTGKEIRFTYQPAGTIGENETRCGIILVRYHNYTCYHRIFVRQGYAPAQIAGPARWHCFNLRYRDTETASPCEEGSLFRFGNIDQPIDASENRFDNFTNRATYPFRLAPLSSGKTGTWIPVYGQTQITNLKSGSAGFSDQPQTIGGKECRVAEYDDFNALKTGCQYAFGILYGDEATETALDVEHAYGYAHYNESNEGKGMRGCFVYNPKGSINSGGEGANIFFPVGVAGYGRRKNCAQEGGKRGVLRYANRGALYTSSDIHYRPMFYTIYTNFGAIYWLNKASNNNVAWDINVSTYDFNTFNNNAFLVSDYKAGDESDACFVRLVE